MKKKLKEISLFSDLSDTELKDLEQITSIHSYEENSLLFSKGEILDYIMILIEGNAYIYKKNKQNKEVIIGYFYKNSILAEPSTLIHQAIPSSCKSISECKIAKVDLKKFEEIFMNKNSVLRGIIKSLLKKIQLLQQNIQINIETSAKDKILEFYKNSFSLSLDLKKYEIAAIIGISPSTFSRYTKELIKEDKLIKIESGFKYKSK